MFLENNCSHRKHAIEMKKAMRYITNRTSCVTFVPATKHSPNFVTIAPGLCIFFLLKSCGNLSEAICKEMGWRYFIAFGGYPDISETIIYEKWPLGSECSSELGMRGGEYCFTWFNHVFNIWNYYPDISIMISRWAVAFYELTLLRPRVDCASSRVVAYTRFRSRAH